MNAFVLALCMVFSMALKVPLETIQHPHDEVVNRMQSNMERALQRLAGTSLDHWNDGTLFKRVLGVNSANQVTSSGIAPYTIVASNVASGTLTNATVASGTLQGSALAAGAVGFDRMTTAGVFSVYRTAAFSMGATATLPVICDTVMKDTAGGYNTANGLYTLPAAGDWLFAWSAGTSSMTNASKQMSSELFVNSGIHRSTTVWSTAAGQPLIGAGSYLHVNGRIGDTVQVCVFNGDSTAVPMSVGSGLNYFCGYQVR